MQRVPCLRLFHRRGTRWRFVFRFLFERASPCWPQAALGGMIFFDTFELTARRLLLCARPPPPFRESTQGHST